jgi:hypothetical protein
MADWNCLHVQGLPHHVGSDSARAAVAPHTDKAVEWFADDTGAVLGAIAYHHCDLEWSFVVFGETSTARSVRFIGTPVCASFDDARRLLVEKMAMAAATGDQGSSPRPAA